MTAHDDRARTRATYRRFTAPGLPTTWLDWFVGARFRTVLAANRDNPRFVVRLLIFDGRSYPVVKFWLPLRHASFSGKRMAFYFLLMSVFFIPLQLHTHCRASGSVSSFGALLAAGAFVLGLGYYRREKPNVKMKTQIILTVGILLFLINLCSVH